MLQHRLNVIWNRLGVCSTHGDGREGGSSPPKAPTARKRSTVEERGERREERGEAERKTEVNTVLRKYNRQGSAYVSGETILR